MLVSVREVVWISARSMRVMDATNTSNSPKREDQTYQKCKQSNDCIITEDACERGELGVRLNIQRKGAET